MAGRICSGRMADDRFVIKYCILESAKVDDFYFIKFEKNLMVLEIFQMYRKLKDCQVYGNDYFLNPESVFRGNVTLDLIV